MTSTASGVERSRSVSSTRIRNLPPCRRAYSQLKSAVRAVPMCIIPVGDGAMRVTGEAGSDIALAPGGRPLSMGPDRLPSLAGGVVWLRAQGRAQSGRLFLWTPVALGLGAAVYLGLKTEPPLAPAALIAAMLGAVALADARLG